MNRVSWIGLVIALVAVTASIGYFAGKISASTSTTTPATDAALTTATNATASLSDQEECAKDAKLYYTENGFSTRGGLSNGYQSHWNTKLGKCFIELSDETNSAGETSIYEALADAIGGTEYAEIDWTIPNEDSPAWCSIYPDGNNIDSTSQSCASKAEFDAFVKDYMQN